MLVAVPVLFAARRRYILNFHSDLLQFCMVQQMGEQFLFCLNTPQIYPPSAQLSTDSYLSYLDKFDSNLSKQHWFHVLFGFGRTRYRSR